MVDPALGEARKQYHTAAIAAWQFHVVQRWLSVHAVFSVLCFFINLHINRAQYNPINEFPYNINGQPVDMQFTSVAGHLMEVRGGPVAASYATDAVNTPEALARVKDMTDQLLQPY